MSDSNIRSLRAAHERCGDCPIRHRAVCSYCAPAQLSELDSIKFYVDYAPGREIVGTGELTRSLGSIVSGVVALQKVLSDGRRQIVGLLFPGDFLGRAFHQRAPFDAVAVTPVRMCLFRRSQFEELLTREPALERRLLEMTLDELDVAREWMVLLGRKTAREKVASFLVVLARRAAVLEQAPLADGLVFQIPLSRDAIAEHLGLTIETVSRQMTQLRKDGVIDLDGARDVRLRDYARLLEASGDDGDWDDTLVDSA